MTPTARLSVSKLLSTPDLAEALESEHFKQFLGHLPIAIAVAKLAPAKRITYTNIAFEHLTGQELPKFEGKDWDSLPPSTPVTEGAGTDAQVPAGEAAEDGTA
jgi:hypothetical protein